MASERQNMSEQEISIKAREHELYVQPGPETKAKPVKPFAVYLRETPAEPLSPTTKAILWIVGTVVALLFLAACWRATIQHAPASRTRKTRPTAKTTMLLSPFVSPISCIPPPLDHEIDGHPGLGRVDRGDISGRGTVQDGSQLFDLTVNGGHGRQHFGVIELLSGLARVPPFRYPMVLKTILNTLLFKGSTDNDLLSDRSLRPDSQYESHVDAVIGGPGSGRFSESRCPGWCEAESCTPDRSRWQLAIDQRGLCPPASRA